MRILIAGTTYFPAMNGQAVFTVNLAEGLVKSGHEVMVAIPSERDHAYHEVRNGVQIEGQRSISMKRLHPEAALPFFSFKAIRRMFDDFQPDVIHIQDHYPLSQAVLWEAKRRGIQSMGTNHFMPENLAPYARWISRFSKLFDWILWRWAFLTYNQLNAVTAPSRTAAALMRQKGLKTAAVPVSNGIDLARFHPDPQADRASICAHYALDPVRKTILFVGRVDAEKRLDVLLNAFRILDREDVQLVIAGYGAALADLKILAANLGVSERVRFPGFIPGEDLPTLLHCADLFAMPGEAELQSIATLEAMASGLPILAANAVALPELVSDQVNGILFRPGDAADAARGLAWILESPQRLKEMSVASLEKIQPHSLQNTIQRYETLYESILGGSVLNFSDQGRLHSTKKRRSSVSNKYI